MGRLAAILLCAVAATAVLVAAATPQEAAPARKGTKVRVADTRYGPILVDGRGRTIYLFTRDAGRRRSRCGDACARAWPPVFTRGGPRAGPGIDRSRLGTVRRRGGRRQVTYKGSPLYFYVGERRAGQILCQDVFEFGGTWYLVRPNGSPV